jgi:hypothetical protein
MEAWLDVVRGESDDRSRILDSAGLLLAIFTALDRNDDVESGSKTLTDTHKDATQFISEYREGKS